MSIGRANEHQRAPEAQPSGRPVSGARATCAGRARADEHHRSPARASAGHQLAADEHRERERESAKNLGLR